MGAVYRENSHVTVRSGDMKPEHQMDCLCYDTNRSDVYLCDNWEGRSLNEYRNLPRSAVEFKDWEGNTVTLEDIDKLQEAGKKALVIFPKNKLDKATLHYYNFTVIQCEASERSHLVSDNSPVTIAPGIVESRAAPLVRADFSSRGPSVYGSDGPVLAAPGSGHIFSARSLGNDTLTSIDFWKATTVKTGTSMACPAVAGMAANFR
jgi:subtilisin family serine protease